MTVVELARLFGVERSVARRWLHRHGFQMRLVRLPQTGNQASNALSRSDALEAISLRRKEGFRVKLTKEGNRT